MKTTPTHSLTVPAFLTKLWNMVNDPETNYLICWNPSGKSFIIKNEPEFTFKLLPAYYKHNNMSSFIRQLNMYGFHKLTLLEDCGKIEKDEMQFYHPHFQKDSFSELRQIKRKVSNIKSISGNDLPPVKPEKLTGLLADVKGLQRKQTNINKQLVDLKQENAVLWQEIIVLRQRHMKQQQIVNKLIHFLVSFVQSSKHMESFGYKRPYPLMIKEKASKRVRRDSDGPTIEEIGASVEELLKESTASSSTQEDLCNLLDVQQHTVDTLKTELPDFADAEIEEITDLCEETEEIPSSLLIAENLYVPEENTNNLTECTLNEIQVPNELSLLNVMPEKEPSAPSPNLLESQNDILKDIGTSQLLEESPLVEIENDLSNDSCGATTTVQIEQSLVPTQKINNANNFSAHINDTQNQLNQLKDLFNNSFVDSNFLLNLFNSDSPENPLQLSDTDTGDPLLSGLEVTPYDVDTDGYEDLLGDIVKDVKPSKKD